MKLREAAERLGIGMAKAFRLKQLAQETGILRTHLLYLPPPHLALQSELQSRLLQHGMREVVVCRASVPQRTARYFEDGIQDKDTVVVDGGVTIRKFVRSLSEPLVRDLNIMPVCADPPSYEYSAYETVVTMAVKCQSLETRTHIPSPGDTASAAHWRRLRRIALRARYVFLGTGPWQAGYTALEFVRHFGHDPRAFRARYPNVKSTCGYFALDEKGQHVPLPDIDCVVGRALLFEDLQRLASGRKCHAVLVAGSRSKVTAVKNAILARVCNTLIIDEELGQGLLRCFNGRPTRERKTLRVTKLHQ
jgi:DNA-binding transcriptional regulator LsrR (DeoR family)